MLVAIARLRRAGRLDEAEVAARAALVAEPGSGALWNELGHVLEARGELASAEDAFRCAGELLPEAAEPRNNLALLLIRRGNRAGALVELERAAALEPDEVRVASNLGALLRDLGQLARAAEILERAVARAPDRASAHMNLGLVLSDLGLVEAALVHLERAVELAPRALLGHDSLLQHLLYVPTAPERPAAAARRYRAVVEPAVLPPAPPARDPDKRLRVGLVSPDLRFHAVAFFLEPLLAHRDPERLELVAYSDAVTEDAVSARLAGACALWRRVANRSDDALAAQIRADGIDILVDLAGHTAGNRLPVFARRPAPLSATYLGYGATTGLGAIDVRLTDAWADPPGADESGYSERLVRMDAGFLCYAPPPGSPEVAPPPSTTGAPPTLASFAGWNKLSDELLALWARLLAAAPGARLLLRDARDPATRARLLDRLAGRGVPIERVALAPHEPDHRAHLEAHRAADVALDTFPYNGVTTTCDALWMGVPVVTLAGSRHQARVGVSLLERAGLGELVARTPDDYVAIALGLLARPRRLARAQLAPLTDGPRVAASFERALRSAWRAQVLASAPG
jgi:predicted O-linked N-acetylglucosamine transferase (SPINDLY family)